MERGQHGVHRNRMEEGSKINIHSQLEFRFLPRNPRQFRPKLLQLIYLGEDGIVHRHLLLLPPLLQMMLHGMHLDRAEQLSLHRFKPTLGLNLRNLHSKQPLVKCQRSHLHPLLFKFKLALRCPINLQIRPSSRRRVSTQTFLSLLLPIDLTRQHQRLRQVFRTSCLLSLSSTNK